MASRTRDSRHELDHECCNERWLLTRDKCNHIERAIRTTEQKKLPVKEYKLEMVIKVVEDDSLASLNIKHGLLKAIIGVGAGLVPAL
jgi:hypothetical protein